MKIGFDIDGVLASFESGLERVMVESTGKNLFPTHGPGGPPVWDWPVHFGYTEGEVATGFESLRNDPDFWATLPELPGAHALRSRAEALLAHDVYFITDRAGIKAKTQTEDWLLLHTGMFNPTVLISRHKGQCAKALGLDCYIDDRPENVRDVALQSDARVYLLRRNYNAQADITLPVQVVSSVAVFLGLEGI